MKVPRLDWKRIFGASDIGAAVFVAILLNVLASRHYTRWDWTAGKLYTLTSPTLETLRALPEHLHVYVLLGGGDPMEQSVRHILEAYHAETDKLDVKYIDPDKDALAFTDVRKRFGIEDWKSSGSDAIIIVARESGDTKKHWFLTASDLVEVSGDDYKAKPREEQALTGAIRRVMAGEKAKLCFLAGHGERALADGSDQGLGRLRYVVERDNFETESIDSSIPNVHEPFKGCSAVIVAPPTVRGGSLDALSDDEVNFLRTYLVTGGNLLLAIGIESEPAASSYRKVLEPFGIGLGDRLVLEGDPAHTLANSRCVTFLLTAKTHPVTRTLVPGDDARTPPRIAADTARAIVRVDTPGVSPTDLLATTDKAYAVTYVRAAMISSQPETYVPERETGDTQGPFVIAMASERPKASKDSAHGPRVVVIGTSMAFAQENFSESFPASVRGGGFFVENAIAWLTDKPQLLDIPARPAVTAGMKISADSESEVRRYVLIYMPGAAALLGIAIALRRRSTEGKTKKQ